MSMQTITLQKSKSKRHGSFRSFCDYPLSYSSHQFINKRLQFLLSVTLQTVIFYENQIKIEMHFVSKYDVIKRTLFVVLFSKGAYIERLDFTRRVGISTRTVDYIVNWNPRLRRNRF